MKLLLILVAVWSGGAFASKQVEEEKDFPALKILVRNCAHCHNQKGHPGAAFLQQENLSDKETMAKVLDVLEKGKMPAGHEEFAKTADGARLIRWLKSQLKAK